MTSDSAARSAGESTGANLPLARSSDFTGIARTRMAGSIHTLFVSP
jgi:hypothetical protein